ncbi:hypothetical protein ACHAWF_008492 [Thalassiosira exigua]
MKLTFGLKRLGELLSSSPKSRDNMKEIGKDTIISGNASTDVECQNQTSAVEHAGLGEITTPPVFFMIGCQRSGSNWLRTLLAEREDLIAPHPPHILRDFMPRLGRYGDLTEQMNLKVSNCSSDSMILVSFCRMQMFLVFVLAQVLIDHVCAFVERNQVPWVDLHFRPMQFNRSAILMDVMITIECFGFNQRYVAKQEGHQEPGKAVEAPYYLLAIFDTIMNVMAKANGKTIWMCKSMGVSQFHDLLLSFYGKERLRYIYLVRDPRDVCLSFMKSPVGDCHPYVIAEKWAKLQNFAARILHETPDLIHQVCYEEVLGDQVAQVAKVMKFVGAREVCKSMRRGSVLAVKSEKEVVSSARNGREATLAKQLSYQFQNLTRGDSFKKGQFKKWAVEMKDEDLILVESVAFEEMRRLGYEPHMVKTKDERIHLFTVALQDKYVAINKSLISKMMENLAHQNPDDLKRRQLQASVLQKNTSFHYDHEFVKSFTVAHIDDALDSIDDCDQRDKGFLTQSSGGIENFDFHMWPLKASRVGFQSDEEVKQRFELKEAQTLEMEGFSLKYAAASQGGYYPTDREKTNQDTFIAGSSFAISTKENNRKWKKIFSKDRQDSRAVLFAVFDGHGPNGAECSIFAREHVLRSSDHPKPRGMDVSNHISSSLTRSYHEASSLLEDEVSGIDALNSGTTATSLVFTKNLMHIANVGDSRCLLIESDRTGKTSALALTTDHTPEHEGEAKRIEACGGVVASKQGDTMGLVSTGLGQKRVWSKTGKGCGTAFTRSIGDSFAKSLGVVAQPDCLLYPLPKTDAAFVLGSDGIFDYISNEEVGNIVAKFDDPADACRELVGKAFNRWCDSEDRTDDITVIVGYLKRVKHGKWGKLR